MVVGHDFHCSSSKTGFRGETSEQADKKRRAKVQKDPFCLTSHAPPLPPHPDSHMSHQSPATFSTLFNQLKRLRCRQPLSSNVVDVRSPDHAHLIEALDVELDERVLDQPDLRHVVPSLTDPSNWRPVFIKSLGPGIVIVPSILTSKSCSQWFDCLLNEYPRFEKGVRSHVDLKSIRQNTDNLRDSGLRWLTFGYHYLWRPKEYDMDHPDPVPPQLEATFKAIASLLGMDFRPEAGIINYYTCKSRLCPHSDFSEPNVSAPLFSLSFGGSAIFMVGGKEKEETPVVPILVSDGDLVIMRGERRLSFHAVPKIYCPQYQSQCSGIVRININARQVF